jgi:hypothetical protein
MKLNIAFSVQSACLNLLSLFPGDASGPRPPIIRSAVLCQTAMLSLNKSTCALATKAGSAAIWLMSSTNEPTIAEVSPKPICPQFCC